MQSCFEILYVILYTWSIGKYVTFSLLLYLFSLAHFIFKYQLAFYQCNVYVFIATFITTVYLCRPCSFISFFLTNQLTMVFVWLHIYCIEGHACTLEKRDFLNHIVFVNELQSTDIVSRVCEIYLLMLE